MTGISGDHVKVHFRMDVDEEGGPPTSVKSSWAVDLGDGSGSRRDSRQHLLRRLLPARVGMVPLSTRPVAATPYAPHGVGVLVEMPGQVRGNVPSGK